MSSDLNATANELKAAKQFAQQVSEENQKMKNQQQLIRSEIDNVNNQQQQQKELISKLKSELIKQVKLNQQKDAQI